MSSVNETGYVPHWYLPDDTSPQFFVLTVCGPGEATAPVTLIKQLLPRYTHTVTDETYAAEHTVCHLRFRAGNTAAWQLFQALLQRFPGLDIAVQPESQRRKKLLICDMDNTIVDAETLDEVAESIGLGEQVAQITESAMRGDTGFYGALRQRISLLKGQPQQIFKDMVATCPLNPGAEQLIRQAKAQGIITLLISGGFAEVAEPIGQQLGFDAVYCNQLELENGVLTGDVAEPIVDAGFKRRTLLRYQQDNGLSAMDCCAIGDGANDIPMLQAAGLGIAFHGKPLTRAATPYQINATTLETALHFMGIAAE